VRYAEADAPTTTTQPPEPPPSMSMVRLLAGFQFSQALYVIAKLDVVTQLDDGARPIDDVAVSCGARPEVLRRLIRTLAPLGVFQQPDENTVQATALGATLSSRRSDSVRDLALYWMETTYLPFSELLHTARTGQPAADRYYGIPFFDWIVGSPDLAELQSRAMADLGGRTQGELLDGYRLPPGAVVADIGGADGTMLSHLLRSEPTRRGVLFDLPAITANARKAVEDRGLADRIEVVGGDFFEAVPTADVYLLSSVLHDWDDPACLRILRSISSAAAPGAWLVLHEGLVPPGDQPHPTKMFDLTMLGILTGKERTAAEFEQLLTAAGFVLERVVPSRGRSILEARLPADPTPGAAGGPG
jgi:hypothetical protein